MAQLLSMTDDAGHWPECEDCPFRSVRADENGVSVECVVTNAYDCGVEVED